MKIDTPVSVHYEKMSVCHDKPISETTFANGKWFDKMGNEITCIIFYEFPTHKLQRYAVTLCGSLMKSSDGKFIQIHETRELTFVPAKEQSDE